ncbi:MAG: alpha/beta hydrolase [Wenzhouxiangellaceae bacterium]|nr:alpha/beta hydrolase [Wenzhouxiangellaceae bacterium]
MSVAEDREQSDGRTIELAWAVVEAGSSEPGPDPVFFLAGGPGQSARDSAPMIARALRDVNRTRDLVFLDQRGTGGSNALDCDFDPAEMTANTDPDRMEALLRECFDALDADVRRYTTTDAVDDLDALRRHLGFEQINLVGGSYGTRVAQVYLRRYPDTVRSVVIDGVVPTRLRLGAEHGRNLDRAIEQLFIACAADAQCAERFADLQGAFDRLKARYGEQPQAITVTHPTTGEPEPLEFNRDVLATSLRFLAYSPEAQMMIPLLVHEADATDDPTRLATQAILTTAQIGDQIAIGLNFAVGCSEDWPHWPDVSAEVGTLLGQSFTDLYGRVCAWWPADPVSTDFHQPFDSEVPMLILSGELDPVTPPRYGEEAAEQFSNSIHLVARGRGHIVMTQPCMGSIVTAFIEQASVDALDTECMDALGPEPFFVNLLGPTP